jgi:hypothetical protein
MLTKAEKESCIALGFFCPLCKSFISKTSFGKMKLEEPIKCSNCQRVLPSGFLSNVTQTAYDMSRSVQYDYAYTFQLAQDGQIRKSYSLASNPLLLAMLGMIVSGIVGGVAYDSIKAAIKFVREGNTDFRRHKTSEEVKIVLEALDRIEEALPASGFYDKIRAEINKVLENVFLKSDVARQRLGIRTPQDLEKFIELSSTRGGILPFMSELNSIMKHFGISQFKNLSVLEETLKAHEIASLKPENEEKVSLPEDARLRKLLWLVLDHGAEGLESLKSHCKEYGLIPSGLDELIYQALKDKWIGIRSNGSERYFGVRRKTLAAIKEMLMTYQSED